MVKNTYHFFVKNFYATLSAQKEKILPLLEKNFFSTHFFTFQKFACAVRRKMLSFCTISLCNNLPAGKQ